VFGRIRIHIAMRIWTSLVENEKFIFFGKCSRSDYNESALTGCLGPDLYCECLFGSTSDPIPSHPLPPALLWTRYRYIVRKSNIPSCIYSYFFVYQDRLLFGLGLLSESGYRCRCYMPHKTPFLEPVVGPVRPSKERAKRACALELVK